MANQIMFANASPERKALYFNIVGEPPIKMLRYQQQYEFFDAAKLGDRSVRFIHLGEQSLEGGMKSVLSAIQKELETSQPAFVIVHSFRSLLQATLDTPERSQRALTDFMQRLALALTTCEATTFLIGEYDDGERDGAVFTVADGLPCWAQQDAKSAAGNLGLGLFIAHQIVLAHDGTLAAHWASGTTTFTVRLPRHVVREREA